VKVHNLLGSEDDRKKGWCDEHDISDYGDYDKKDGSHEIFSNVEKKKLIEEISLSLRGSLDKENLPRWEGEHSFDWRMKFEGYVVVCEVEKERFSW